MASNGFFDFGAALGGHDTSKIEQEAIRGVAGMESALIKAKKESDELNAIQEMRQTLIDNDVPEEQANIVSTLMRAGKNPEQLSGYQLDQQTMGFRDSAMDQAVEGDIDAMNPILSVLAQRPLTQNKIEGNTIINPFMSDANPRTTEIGDSVIETNEARAAKALRAPAPRASRPGRPTRDPVTSTAQQAIQNKYRRLMAEDGADRAALSAAMQAELDAVTAPQDITSMLADPVQLEAPVAAPVAAPPRGKPTEQKTIGGKLYSKINGQWYEQ